MFDADFMEEINEVFLKMKWRVSKKSGLKETRTNVGKADYYKNVTEGEFPEMS